MMIVTAIENELISLIVADTHIEREALLQHLLDPQWERAGKCHDWRNHVHSDMTDAMWR